MAVKISPPPRQQFLDSNGDPISGGQLFTYTAGTTTKENTFTTSDGLTANANPIVLDSSGRTPDGVWLTAGVVYKFVLAPAGDTDPPASPIFTEDNVSGTNDTATVASAQWAASAMTPTFVSTTSFTVPGDQTSTLDVGRRCQFTVSGGTVYGNILTSAYTSLTTVTMTMDAGDALDAGLSSFNVGILSGTNHSVPKLTDAHWTQNGLVVTGSDNTLSGVLNMSGKEINEAVHTEAAHATTADIWTGGNTCLLSGSAVTFTDVADAPQAGAIRHVIANAAHVITDNANIEMQGDTNYTCKIGDVLRWEAKTTTTFRVSVVSRWDGRSLVPEPGIIIGGVATNATTDADHDIHISAVKATNSSGTTPLSLAADTDRATDTLWVEGGAGLMAEDGTGGSPRSLPASGTVYLFIISKDSDGTLDFCCDDSSSGANIGTASSATDGWTVERLIDKIQTDASNNLKPFVVDGDKDKLAHTIRRFYNDSLVVLTDPIGTSEAASTVQCPPNETAILDVRIAYTAAAANRHARVYPTTGDDVTPAAGNSNLQVHGTQAIAANTRLEIPVDGSSQVNSKADAGLSASNISTAGYIIHR